jgi:UDP-N-acetylmuramate dehydrogenase
VTAPINWGILAAAIERDVGVRPRRDESLAGHTTMRVGGPADLLVEARDARELGDLVRLARARNIPYVVLGRGSNLVVSDVGIRGLVILSRAEGYRIEGDRLIAEAGMPLARAATVTGRAGLAGLEFGLAIPGTVGGAVWANAGAHGSDVAAVLESVSVLREDGTEAKEAAASLELQYRDSRFKRRPQLILGAVFRLRPDAPDVIRKRLEEIRSWRQAHQPIGLPSAGSVFRNPAGDSAGRLIDACGLKGARVGGATISEKHANFIVNDREATAADVRGLAEMARREVSRRFGVELTYEVQYLGDWSGWGQEER